MAHSEPPTVGMTGTAAEQIPPRFPNPPHPPSSAMPVPTAPTTPPSTKHPLPPHIAGYRAPPLECWCEEQDTLAHIADQNVAHGGRGDCAAPRGLRVQPASLDQPDQTRTQRRVPRHERRIATARRRHRTHRRHIPGVFRRGCRRPQRGVHTPRALILHPLRLHGVQRHGDTH